MLEQERVADLGDVREMNWVGEGKRVPWFVVGGSGGFDGSVKTDVKKEGWSGGYLASARKAQSIVRKHSRVCRESRQQSLMGRRGLRGPV